jgi:hypothetical protein
MIVLLIAGVVVILAGLAAIGFGIPVKEFGFGNTLILTGTVGACTGLIMISLALAVRELKSWAPFAQDAEPADPVRLPRRELKLPPVDEDGDGEDDSAAPKNAPLFARDQPALGRPTGPEPGVPPWQDEVLRDRERLAASASTEIAPPDEPKRRNLLFSSSRRERAEANAEASENDTTAESATEQPKRFEDSWPQQERPRSDAIRRAARAPSTFTDRLPDTALIPDRYVPPAPVEDARPAGTTVLKSGVVDGMAYSLYSDGSIEAQMPEGMMRFTSIDELRDHLDNRT